MTGRIFGTPDEVRKLAKVIQMTLEAIDQGNEKAKSLLDELSTTSKDKSYTTAESVVEEVKAIADSCREPAEEIENQLKDYANFLDSIVTG